MSGSPDDVTTEPGDHATFRVITGCTVGDFGVKGAGSVKLATTQEIANAGADLYAELQTIASVWRGGGAGLVCTSGAVGTQIELDDWRDVDAVIEMTGAWLHERDLDLEVGISVAPVPHANAHQ